MLIGNTEITREQMPSFVDFANNPKHLYNLMQDQLSSALNRPMPAQPSMPVQQPNSTNIESNTNSQWGRN